MWLNLAVLYTPSERLTAYVSCPVERAKISAGDPQYTFKSSDILGWIPSDTRAKINIHVFPHSHSIRLGDHRLYVEAQPTLAYGLSHHMCSFCAARGWQQPQRCRVGQTTAEYGKKPHTTLWSVLDTESQWHKT